MTVYEAVAGDKPTVTKLDVERLQMIEDQHEAVQHVILNSRDPIAVAIFYAHDGVSVVARVLSVQEAFDAKKKFDSTGEALVLTISGPPSGLAAILRKRKLDQQANIIEASPPDGTTFVVCIAHGGASVAAIPHTPLKTLGSA